MTEEEFVEAAQLCLANHGAPDVEHHHPRCPKIVTGGERACRCGANWLEAAIEDAMERSQ